MSIIKDQKGKMAKAEDKKEENRKSTSIEVLYTIRVFEAAPQYAHALRLVSELPDLRAGHAVYQAKPSPCLFL
jgi:hypothetical protein